MKNSDINKIQKVQMRIMDEIHRICVKKNYRYYLIGGSALGAIRHNGIIPWDVDIDIAMPRKDYEQFLSEGYKELSDSFSLHYHETDRDFGSVHALVVLNNSEIVFTYEVGSKLKNRFGIFVDILPLDQWPDDDNKKQKQIRDIKRIRLLTSLHSGTLIRKEDSSIERCTKKIISAVLRFVVPRYKINKMLQNVMKKYDTEDEGKYWCSMASHYSLDKLTMPKEYFGSPILHSFSGREYFVPEKVELYLKQLFGDYMKEPSEESKNAQMESIYYACWIDENGCKIELR